MANPDDERELRAVAASAYRKDFLWSAAQVDTATVSPAAELAKTSPEAVERADLESLPIAAELSELPDLSNLWRANVHSELAGADCDQALSGVRELRRHTERQAQGHAATVAVAAMDLANAVRDIAKDWSAIDRHDQNAPDSHGDMHVIGAKREGRDIFLFDRDVAEAAVEISAWEEGVRMSVSGLRRLGRP